MLKISDLLKDVPSKTRLYTSLFPTCDIQGTNCYFDIIDEMGKIYVSYNSYNTLVFSSDGSWMHDVSHNIRLYPNKKSPCWETFKTKYIDGKYGDEIVRKCFEQESSTLILPRRFHKENLYYINRLTNEVCYTPKEEIEKDVIEYIKKTGQNLYKDQNYISLNEWEEKHLHELKQNDTIAVYDGDRWRIAHFDCYINQAIRTKDGKIYSMCIKGDDLAKLLVDMKKETCEML